MELNLIECLVWKTTAPSKSIRCESPVFSVCKNDISYEETYLTLDIVQECGHNYYYLNLRRKEDKKLYTYGVCEETMGIAVLEFGCTFLSGSRDRREYYSGNLWKVKESDIPKVAFYPYHIWMFHVIFKIKDVKLNQDTSLKTVEKSIQTSLYLSRFPCLESLSKDHSKLLDEGAGKDVQLKCGDQAIGAHKNILSARSPVFSRMFDSDMKEKQTSVVEIQDIDSKLFLDFLRYLYTGTLPELTINTAIQLYEVGDKYAVKPLMRRCSDYLTENLTLDNACEMLCLADAHNDEDVKEYVTKYIIEKKIPLTYNRWQDFCRSHSVLAVEVLNRFCELYVSLEA